MTTKIIGAALPDMPWQPRPQGCQAAVWRHDANPIIDWNPIPCAARIFNSAVVAYEGAFIGVFRADYKNGRPHLHVGRSQDALHWDIDHQAIRWVDEQGRDAQPTYAYDPRVVKIEDTYYITWSTDNHGATLGMRMTNDFKTLVRLEDA